MSDNGIKITDLKAQKNEAFKKQGGRDALRTEFKNANNVAQLKAVLAKILKAQGVLDDAD